MGFINIVFLIKWKITYNVDFVKSSKNIENSSFEKLKNVLNYSGSNIVCAVSKKHFYDPSCQFQSTHFLLLSFLQIFPLLHCLQHLMYVQEENVFYKRDDHGKVQGFWFIGIYRFPISALKRPSGCLQFSLFC